ALSTGAQEIKIQPVSAEHSGPPAPIPDDVPLNAYQIPNAPNLDKFWDNAKATKEATAASTEEGTEGAAQSGRLDSNASATRFDERVVKEQRPENLFTKQQIKESLKQALKRLQPDELRKLLKEKPHLALFLPNMELNNDDADIALEAVGSVMDVFG